LLLIGPAGPPEYPPQEGCPAVIIETAFLRKNLSVYFSGSDLIREFFVQITFTLIFIYDISALFWPLRMKIF
jgi:hypothetical protein